MIRYKFCLTCNFGCFVFGGAALDFDHFDDVDSLNSVFKMSVVFHFNVGVSHVTDPLT